jgi:hypothetical protein
MDNLPLTDPRRAASWCGATEVAQVLRSTPNFSTFPPVSLIACILLSSPFDRIL